MLTQKQVQKQVKIAISKNVKKHGFVVNKNEAQKWVKYLTNKISKGRTLTSVTESQIDNMVESFLLSMVA